MPALTLSLFGPVQADVNGRSLLPFRTNKVQALLIYLAVEAALDAPRRHQREALMNLFWPDAALPSAQANLRQTLYHLRQAIPELDTNDGQTAPFLLVERQTVQINPAVQYDLDVAAFSQLLASNDDEEAVALYRGDFLADFYLPDSAEFETWAETQREMWRRQALAAMSSLTDTYDRQGDFDRAEALARRQLELDSWRESAHRQLMIALAKQGQRSEALAQYNQCIRLLAEELAIEPERETTAVYQQILADELYKSPPIPLTTNLPDPQNPYKGLHPFYENDAPHFFGRAALIQRLLAHFTSSPLHPLTLSRFLAIVGPSGSGKSSVAYAGLIPALRQGAAPGSDQWLIAHMMPGKYPLEELEAALLRVADAPPADLLSLLQSDERGLLRALKQLLPPSGELFLFVDQFEELFTLTETAVGAHFLRLLQTALADPRSQLRLTIALRADFYDRPLNDPDWGVWLREETELALPLAPAELEQAISEPARQAGVALEPGLAATLLTDINHQPGALPLLQYTLTELFDERDCRTLTQSAYQQIGGVTGAIASRAETLYAQLDAAEQTAAQSLFLHLAAFGDGDEPTRRRVAQTELSAMMGRVAELFGRYRLLSFDRDPATGAPTVEIAHEALLTHWPRLRRWLENGRDDVRQQRQLARAAAEWQTADVEASFLLRGNRLAQIETWAEQTALRLTDTERHYLDASLAARAAQKTAESERQARETALEQRSRTFLRSLVAVLLVAMAGALAVTIFSLGQSRELEQERDNAVAAQATGEANRQLADEKAAEALQAYSLSLSANARQALSDGETGAALRLALEAATIVKPAPETMQLLRAAAYAPNARALYPTVDYFGEELGAATAVATSKTVSLLGFEDGTIVWWDNAAEQEITRKQAHDGPVNVIAIAPDGEIMLTGGADGSLIAWRGQESHPLPPQSGRITAVAIHPDGKTAVSANWRGDDVYQPGNLVLWDLTTGQEIRRMSHQNGILDAAFTPDGRFLLAASGKTTYQGSGSYELILWDWATGEPEIQFDTATHDNISLAISPDGQTALTGSSDHNLYLWRLSDDALLQAWSGHDDAVTAVAFTPDGQRALSGSADGGLILWDISTAVPLAHLNLHQESVYGLAVDENGRQAFSTAADGNLILWDISMALNTSLDGSALPQLAAHTASALDVAFSPDGKRIFTSGGRATGDQPIADDNAIRLWNAASGDLSDTMTGHTDAVFQIAVSPNGKRLLSASYDATARLWDVESGEEIQGLALEPGIPNVMITALFHPDGETAVISTLSGEILVWDFAANAISHRFVGHMSPVWATALSPNGRFLLSGGDDDGLFLWDWASGELVQKFAGHEDTVTAVAFAPDGETAVSSGNEGLLMVWDTVTGAKLAQYPGHEGVRTRLALTQDGRYLISSGWDGQIIIRELASGDEIHRWSAHPDAFIMDMALSPDEKSMVTAATDGRVHQWRLPDIALEDLQGWIAANRYVTE